MNEEPKSMLRYVAFAAVLVAPALYFINTHIDTKVAPLSGFIAQSIGAPTGNSQVARQDEGNVSR